MICFMMIMIKDMMHGNKPFDQLTKALEVSKETKQRFLFGFDTIEKASIRKLNRDREREI